MVNVILVDDEEPALLEMEYLLKQYPEINITGKFTNPVEALEVLERQKPQAVFIDINMPQLNGMDFARRLQMGFHGVEVIFVTAYEQYALEAFRVEAVDYLLKPILKEQLDQTVERLLNRKREKGKHTKAVLEIRTMGEFCIKLTGKDPLRWRTEKEKELLAFLLNNMGRGVSRDRIINELWGEYEVERAIRQLHNAIYYIKKTLADYGIREDQISIEGHYILKLGDVWYDREIIKSKVKELEESQSIEELEAVLELFAGTYHQFEGWQWAEQEREVLAQKERDILIGLSSKYLEAGYFSKSELTLKRALANNPFDENIIRLLMSLYRVTGEVSKAVRHYREYEKLLKEELGIVPDKDLAGLYKEIQQATK